MGADPILDDMPHDIGGFAGGLLGQIQYKLLFGILGMFLFLSSTYYMENVLAAFDGAIELGAPTSWGYGITLMFLAMGFILLDSMIRTGVL